MTGAGGVVMRLKRLGRFNALGAWRRLDPEIMQVYFMFANFYYYAAAGELV